MSDVKAIEDAVRSLPPRELAEFRRWFAEFDNVAWDAQLDGGRCTLEINDTHWPAAMA